MTTVGGDRRSAAGRPLRRRHLGTVGGVAVLLLMGWCFPPFHVVPLTRAGERERATAFDPARAARQLWESDGVGAFGRAADAATVLAALERDPTAARQRYGHVFGVSSTTLFLLKGTGRVVSVESDAVIVAVEGAGTRLRLTTGPVVGNLVRDATGLLDVSDYANSQDFNAIASELNRIVESEVTPRLREHATLGQAIRFVACARLREGLTGSLPAIAVQMEPA